MILQKYKKKLKTFFNVIKFIYGKYPWAATTRSLLSLVSIFASVYSITIVGKFIDEVSQILLNWNSFDISQFWSSQAFFNLVLIFLLWSIIQVVGQVNSYLYDLIYERTWEDAKFMMIAKVSKSDLQDVEQERYQDLLTYIPSYSIDRIVQTYDRFSTILSSFISLVSAGIIIFDTMSWSVLLLLLFAVPQVIIVHIRRKRIRDYQDREVGRLKYLNYLNTLSLTISNFSELRVNNIFTYLKRRFRGEYDEYEEGYLKRDMDFYRDRSAVTVLGQALKTAYVVYVLAISIIKRLSIGTFKALYDYVDLVYTSIYNIFDSFSFISTLLGYDEKFFDLIDYEGFGDYEHGQIKLKEGTPSVELKNLDFSYPDDPETLVLKDINIDIQPGQKVAFFGGDGSGKSSMVKILTGLYAVKKGDYLIDGYSTKDLDRGQLKKKISVTFQDFIDYNFSVKENIVISGERKNINQNLYEEISKASQVNNFLRKDGIEDTHILGKTFPGGKELSPGYWQRLAIARMLYRNKQIFIMDESFTFIDSESKDNILRDVISFVGAEKTLIYITRNIDNLDLFDKIFFFDNGKVIESGTWTELMSKKGKFFKIVKGNF